MMRFPLQSAVLLETSYISLDDCIAALQHSGVEEAVGSHEVDLTNQISSRTMSCPQALARRRGNYTKFQRHTSSVAILKSLFGD